MNAPTRHSLRSRRAGDPEKLSTAQRRGPRGLLGRLPMPAPSLLSKRRIEPLVWLGFSGGGVAAATLLPVLVFLFAFAFPLGWIDPPNHDHLLAVAGNPITVLVLLGFFTVLLVHAAHRFRYTLYDGLQIKQKGLTALACYGGAALGLVATTVVLLELMDVSLGAG